MDLYAFKKGIGFSHFAYSECAEEVKLVSWNILPMTLLKVITTHSIWIYDNLMLFKILIRCKNNHMNLRLSETQASVCSTAHCSFT